MKTLFTALLLLIFPALAAAQNKVTVPLSDPTQPATVKARLITGSITVTASTDPQVVIESDTAGRGGTRPPEAAPPPGMHRIDVGSEGFTAEEDHNVVTIAAGRGGRGANLAIQVPPNTSLEIRTVMGHIDVTGLSGDLDIENVNGAITLKNISGAVSAHTVTGGIAVEVDKAPPEKAMSFTSLNGTVDVTLPADTKARLHLKTANGAIFSDFDVKMEAGGSPSVVEDGRGQGGKYRIRMDRGVYGTINGGGPEYSFQTVNGKILIHRK